MKLLRIIFNARLILLYLLYLSGTQICRYHMRFLVALGRRRLLHTARRVLGRRYCRRPAFPRPVLVVGVLAAVQISQPLRLLDERSAILVRQLLPTSAQTLANLSIVHYRLNFWYLSALNLYSQQSILQFNFLYAKSDDWTQNDQLETKVYWVQNRYVTPTLYFV